MFDVWMCKWRNFNLSLRKGLILFILLAFGANAIIIAKSVDHETVRSLLSSNKLLLLGALGVVLLSWMCDAGRFCALSHAAQERVPFSMGIVLTWLNYFGSAVTPMQSGGGPFQVYVLYKKGVPIGLFDLEAEGYFYTRLQNPTSDRVAAKIAALEGGTAAMLTASGQAATFYSIFNLASAGDHVVASSAIYGGSFNLFNVTMRRMGIDFTFVDPDCTDEALAAAFKPNTKAVFGETIANPALIVFDIERFAKAAHAHGVPLIIDNTFATPINCRPFEWGGDIVTHSTTKPLPGFFDYMEAAGIRW